MKKIFIVISLVLACFLFADVVKASPNGKSKVVMLKKSKSKNLVPVTLVSMSRDISTNWVPKYITFSNTVETGKGSASENINYTNIINRYCSLPIDVRKQADDAVAYLIEQDGLSYPAVFQQGLSSFINAEWALSSESNLIYSLPYLEKRLKFLGRFESLFWSHTNSVTTLRQFVSVDSVEPDISLIKLNIKKQMFPDDMTISDCQRLLYLQLDTQHPVPKMRSTRDFMNAGPLLKYVTEWARSNSIKTVGVIIPEYRAIIEAQNTGTNLQASLEAVGLVYPSEWNDGISNAMSITNKILKGLQLTPTEKDLAVIEMYLGVDGLKNFNTKYNSL